ncbi:L-serine ammonia-lyase, iron-sulfur-dependent subunit beta [Clostridium minihomine]|uniref:L-serine ammonia-lyase, iron-sulfur-dependent subunit beta n=1 Tax=Clostridium minihomine TaxID=2045012 RepID=UPI000C75DF6C|nr:L-serine ammonia-lyase, iron-sulfur-dependent subunit beta [Clostridium minihomine]
MNISIFEVIGPVMIGSSSSHTAGAARLARVAKMIAGGRPFHRVTFGLHGSFAKTYRGHGTDRALVFGALGYYEDDERLPQAFELAQKAGLSYEFYETKLEGVHENTAVITFEREDGSQCVVIGSSIGGAQIIITNIDGFPTEFTAQSPALILSYRDRPGAISELTGILAGYRINIAVMKVSRAAKGGTALCTIETDDLIPEQAVTQLEKIQQVFHVRVVNIGKGEE